MYQWLRNMHLLLGLFCFLFLLMYGLSAVQMSHNRWFNLKPHTAEGQAQFEPGLEARPLAQQLMDTQGLRGELTQISRKPDGLAFRIVRPGTVCEIHYVPETGVTKIRTHTANFMGMLNRIHHIGGLWHEYSLINVWGFFVGFVSLALIALGITGIYLWFKIHKERIIGVVLLTVSLGFSLTLLVLMRTA